MKHKVENEYYNKEKKERYLEYLYINKKSTRYINNYKTLFKKISIYEMNLDKDIANFTKEEFLYIFKKLFDIKTFQTNQSKLKQYIKYYSNESSVNIVQNIKCEEISNFEEIIESILTRNMLYNEVLPKLKNNQDKLFFAMFFENIVQTKQELSNIKISDMDLNIKKIDIKRNNQVISYEISRELYPILTSAILETVRKTYSKLQNKKIKFKNTCYLLKTINKNTSNKVSENSYNNLTNEIKNYLIENYDLGKLYAKMLSTNQLIYSGMLEKLMRIENPQEHMKEIYVQGTGNKEYSYTTLKKVYEALSENTLLREENNSFENEQRWVTEKSEMGLKAENLVLKYFENIYSCNYAYKVHAYNGYDLRIGNAKVEVKNVSNSPRKYFYMSVNELLQAEKLGDSYYLALVTNDEDIFQTMFIKNPIKELNIDVNFINRKIDFFNSNISIQNIGIEPSKVCSIDLNAFNKEIDEKSIII